MKKTKSLQKLHNKILSETGAVKTLTAYGLEGDLSGTDSFLAIEDDVALFTADEYRSILPVVLNCILQFGVEATTAVSIEAIIELPQAQYQKEKFGSSNLISELKARKVHSPGWIAPALSALSSEERCLVVAAIEELLSEVNDVTRDFFESDLLRLTELIIMAGDAPAP